MKNKPLSILGISIFLLLILFTVACKKTSEPQNPQLIGNWLQITNQDTVYFYVDDLGGTLYITKMKVSITSETSYTRYNMSNTSGIAPIDENNHFYLIIEEGGQEGPTYIDGTFNPTTLVLMGNFAYYILGQPSRINYPYTIQRP
jgi:hypothetical protein